MRFDPETLSLTVRGMTLASVAPLLDGAVPPHTPPVVVDDEVRWALDDGGSAVLTVGTDTLDLRIDGLSSEQLIDSIGLQFGTIAGVGRALRNGYTSWDGSEFIDWGTAFEGHAMTALLPPGGGAAVIGFDRHDRWQSRVVGGGGLSFETLIDRVPHDGSIAAERLVVMEDADLETVLRAWSHAVAAASPLPPRVPDRRITGWCSWYNLYAAIDDELIREHLASTAAFRDEHQVPLDVFLIDDGFTPEMGDWLDFKPQFPRGMAPLVADIAVAGFTPGLWIAPFMVGNRSKLFAAHPDWVVADATTGAPLAPMTFYGEFRWHKRSEEYYILDVTHPDAAAYIAHVFRTWACDWGVGYFKTDFMYFGSAYGPDRARWHIPGLSRIAIWRRMAAIIREAIGEALWLGCGCPLWASVGYVDAVRIGRDIGPAWASGEQSAASLLRDQLTRNHAHRILWHADPDCILLRDRFHDLDDAQVDSLARFAGRTGGVLMTSDSLDALSPERAALFAELLRADTVQCDFPGLGSPASILVQRAYDRSGSMTASRLNLLGLPSDDLPPFATRSERVG